MMISQPHCPDLRPNSKPNWLPLPGDLWLPGPSTPCKTQLFSTVGRHQNGASHAPPEGQFTENLSKDYSIQEVNHDSCKLSMEKVHHQTSINCTKRYRHPENKTSIGLGSKSLIKHHRDGGLLNHRNDFHGIDAVGWD